MPFFDFGSNKGLCPLFQSPLFGVSIVIENHRKDNTGHNIIDLLNDVLVDKADLEALVVENEVVNKSAKTPGLIIQAYLVLVELFNLDVMEPLQRIKTETVEIEGKVILRAWSHRTKKNLRFYQHLIRIPSGDLKQFCKEL